MIFTERYKDIIKTENDIATEYNNDYYIENNVIKDIRVLVTGHFGNIVSIDMVCENICPIPLYNNIHNIGYIIRCLIELFDKENDDSVNLNELKDTPIRIVFDDKNPYNGKAIAIGHFMSDRFIMIEDLMRLEK